jgi:hypothetical protein
MGMRNLIVDGSIIADRGEIVATQKCQFWMGGVDDSKVLFLVEGWDGMGDVHYIYRTFSQFLQKSVAYSSQAK